MSYLNIASSNVPDFTKAVISLWFRVPAASLNAASGAGPTGPLANIVPLIAFGGPFTQTEYTFAFTHVASSPNYTIAVPSGYYQVIAGTWFADVVTVSPGQTADLDPSYLGLMVSQDGTVSVEVSLQTSAIAQLSNYFFVVGGTSSYVDPGIGPGSRDVEHVSATSAADVSYAFTGTPERYRAEIRCGTVGDFADKWHHLLVSCDLSKSVSTLTTLRGGSGNWEGVSSYNSMWVALDDVNYTGADAFPNFLNGQPPNACLSDGAILGLDGFPAGEALSVQVNPPVLIGGPSTPPPTGESPGLAFDTGFGFTCAGTTCTVPASPVRINGKYIGIPADASHVANIYHCEMAEFQMFTGVSMDTGVLSNRRAFIGADGKPVNPLAVGPAHDPTTGDATGLINPGPPAKLLGKPADVALISRSSNWMRGINTGKVKGGFRPTGKIKPYLPNPKLGV